MQKGRLKKGKKSTQQGEVKIKKMWALILWQTKTIKLRGYLV